MALTPGARLGPYELVTSLGAGRMGEVYRAHDSRLARDVAIKVIRDTTAGRAGSRERFEREARAVAALSHPNIVGIMKSAPPMDASTPSWSCSKARRSAPGSSAARSPGGRRWRSRARSPTVSARRMQEGSSIVT